MSVRNLFILLTTELHYARYAIVKGLSLVRLARRHVCQEFFCLDAVSKFLTLLKRRRCGVQLLCRWYADCYRAGYYCLQARSDKARRGHPAGPFAFILHLSEDIAPWERSVMAFVFSPFYPLSWRSFILGLQFFRENLHWNHCIYITINI